MAYEGTKYVQDELRKAGYYKGNIDGIFYDVSKGALSTALADAARGRAANPTSAQPSTTPSPGTTTIGVTPKKLSAEGIALIHSFETLKLTSYKDPGSKNGLPITNGWGTTVEEGGGPIKLGAVWTKEKADRLFARDIAAFERDVNFLIGKAPTTQNQFDALVSFAYNVGSDIDEDTIPEGLGDSTLLKRHLAGDYAGAANAFLSWVYNDGKKMRGLERRRQAERALYLGQEWRHF